MKIKHIKEDNLMRLEPIKNLFSIVDKQEYNLKYFQEYLRNQNGELATPEKIDEIKQKRQEFINFLISEHKTWLFDIEIEKTLQQWQVVIAIQNILDFLLQHFMTIILVKELMV